MPSIGSLIQIDKYPTYGLFVVIIGAVASAVILLPLWIRLVRYRNIGQQVRADGPQGHLVKQGTPTMGGVLIMLVVCAVFLLAGRTDPASVLVLCSMLACGVLGFVDDYAKVVKERSLGLTALTKIGWQIAISLTIGMLAVNWVGVNARIDLPLLGFNLDLGILSTTISLMGHPLVVPWLYLALVCFMVVGFSNTVNLADGLDGLAAGTVTIVMFAFAAIAFQQKSLPVALVGASVAGACIGFLWYNSYPADIFMGDTGSLGLGAVIAALAIVTKTELLSVLIGGIYVIEGLSVILQVASFKLTGKRLFLMAPIHHHFEMKGWSETKIMVRFWIVTGVFAGAGFGLYYLSRIRVGP
jgi:phospho-N-acetylmuramoyl-pentapeptide-transferase